MHHFLDPLEDDRACWRDYEIKLGEEEGRKVAVDSCPMLLRRAAAAADALCLSKKAGV